MVICTSTNYDFNGKCLEELQFLLKLFTNSRDSSHFIKNCSAFLCLQSYFIYYIDKATKCNGDNQNQFPSNGYFGAVSVALWDNGGACGRKYQIRCISGRFHPCTNRSIVVQIVDFCRKDPCPATMALSRTAFGALSRYLSKINVEYILI